MATLAGLLLSLAATPAVAAPTTGTTDATAADATTAGTASEPFIDEQALFKQGDFGYFCFRIPALVRATNGMVLAFAEGRVKDCGDDGDIDLVLRRSTDGGHTWGPLQVVSKGNGETHGNPVPIVDRRTGRVVVVTTHNGPDPCPDGCDRDPYVNVSDDNGATWSADRELTDAKRPEWNHWYATGPMHGIQLERGPHAGRLVVGASFESWDRVGPHVYGTHLLYSDDDGETWHIGAQTSVDDGTVIAQEVTVVELTDGRIYALARERGTDPGSRAFATSSDGGETWDAPFKTMPELVMPDVQASMLRYSAKDQGDKRDRILLSSPAHPSSREAMTVRSSYDEGRSWQSWRQGKVFWWGQSAYSDMVRLDGDETGLAYEAGVANPYESIRYARFNEAYLKTPNGTPPGIPGKPEPGPKTPDLSNGHNPAYVRGDAQLTTGRYGNALALDGVDDRVEVPFDRSIDLGADDFTLTTWIRYGDTGGSHAIVWLYRVGSGTIPQVWLRAEPASHRLIAMLSVDRFNVSVASTTAYNDNQWHHLALERAGGKFSLLVDGFTVASATAPAGSVTAGAKDFGVQGIHIGERLDGIQRFHGAIDDVRVYRRALSSTELAAIRDQDATVRGGLGLRLEFENIK